MDKLKSLSKKQIEQLENQGCLCANWSRIKVSDNFIAERVRNVRFVGDVELGTFAENVEIGSGKVPSGVYNALIINSRIEDNVYINNVRGHISNYIIREKALLEGIGILELNGQSSFGNGVQVSVINENDGRAIPICAELSCQTAYLAAIYRANTKLTEKLRGIILEFAEKSKSKAAIIESNAKLINCGVIRNVYIGEFAIVEGVDNLDNGSILSCRQDPVKVGAAVKAVNFIIGCGSKVENGVILRNSFVGQGCEIMEGFCCEDSVFFANCLMSRGESFSIFAGPFTVSHHKATLLIASIFSFYNAGSGTNQSNHMYKLGPMHQGVVERGCKNGSGSYFLWPARIGAFTLIKGRVCSNSDTSDLPFSYLLGYETGDILIPGISLSSVGTIRDAKKWAKRERRKCSDKLDFVNTDILSPYTMNKVRRGIRALKSLEDRVRVELEYVQYRGVKIGLSWLDRGKKIYQTVLDKFLGDCLIERLTSNDFSDESQLRQILKPKTDYGNGEWVDIGGMYAPKEAVNDIISQICDDKLKTLKDIRAGFGEIFDKYPEYCWNWAAALLEDKLGAPIEKAKKDDILNLIDTWHKETEKWYGIVLDDARKEFSESAMKGYGLDGDKKWQLKDFNAVRGEYDDNKFVKQINLEIQEVKHLSESVSEKVRNILK